MDVDNELPPLLEGESLLVHPSFHESSTNVSIADSAAATLGSESFQDLSDRGQMSSNSSSNEEESDADSYVESSNSNRPAPKKKGFHDSDLSEDDDWVEEPSDAESSNNIK